MSMPITLELEPTMQYSLYHDVLDMEYYVCNPYNGAALVQVGGDAKYILIKLNTGAFHLVATEVTKQCATSGNYYQAWEYRIITY